jgi:hypothetical protein
MPFENHGNRAFTLTSVDRNAPAASGVYGLSNAHHWIYVGETGNIQAELFRHLRHGSEFLKEQNPSGFAFEVCSAEHRMERHNRLLFELEPIGNLRGGQLMNSPSPEE